MIYIIFISKGIRTYEDKFWAVGWEETGSFYLDSSYNGTYTLQLAFEKCLHKDGTPFGMLVEE